MFKSKLLNRVWNFKLHEILGSFKIIENFEPNHEILLSETFAAPLAKIANSPLFPIH